jgi:hypothetical protein
VPAARDVCRYSGTCRSLAYAGEGALRRRHHEQQTEQMWCLTLATNAIVTWTTEYHGLAVAALRRPVHRRRGPGPHLAHPPRATRALGTLRRPGQYIFTVAVTRGAHHGQTVLAVLVD